MSWHLGRMTVFDLETTGTDPEEARIVTACVGTVGGGMDTDVRQWLADPGIEIPTGASDVHGITTEYAREHGDDPIRVVTEVATALTVAWSLGRPVVAYNGQYDFTVLDREVRRFGVSSVGFPVVGPVIDPYVIDRHVDRYRRAGLGGRKLEKVAAHYAVPLNGAHDAAEDALAAARVAWRIASRYPQIAAMTLDDLHQAQIGWYREQQEGLAAHFRATGKPTDGISMAWPKAPYPAVRS